MIRNQYVVRKVAESDSRACFICYRPTTSVMVNEVPQADFFYACPAHVADPGFAILTTESQKLIDDQTAKVKEIERLRAEWQSVQAKKQTSAQPVDSAEPDKSKPTKSDLAEVDTSEASQPMPVRRVYELNRGVFNLRLNAKRRAAQDRKTQAMLSNPELFPAVPKHKPK